MHERLSDMLASLFVYTFLYCEQGQLNIAIPFECLSCNRNLIIELIFDPFQSFWDTVSVLCMRRRLLGGVWVNFLVPDQAPYQKAYLKTIRAVRFFLSSS
jgi:hypothetical protein